MAVLPRMRRMEANDGLLVRSQNVTNGNNATFSAAMIWAELTG